MNSGALVILAQVGRHEDTALSVIGIVAVVLIFGTLIVINILKGKYWTAAVSILGVVGLICGIVGASRIAKPKSWWARHRYGETEMREARYRHEAAEVAEASAGDQESKSAPPETAEPTPPSLYCPHCGKQARPGSAYCAYRGASLPAAV